MIEQKILQDEEITEFIVEGEYTTDDVIETIKNTYKDITKYVLWNCRSGHISNLDSNEMKRIASVAKKHSVHEKTAFVASSDLMFGLLRMYETHSRIENVPLSMQVFRERSDAIKWLRE